MYTLLSSLLTNGLVDARYLFIYFVTAEDTPRQGEENHGATTTKEAHKTHTNGSISDQFSRLQRLKLTQAKYPARMFYVL